MYIILKAATAICAGLIVFIWGCMSYSELIAPGLVITALGIIDLCYYICRR